MHSKNVVHRDLKPSNVLIRDFKNFEGIVIIDFGLACDASDLEGLKRKCGTPGFTAPEVFSDKLYMRTDNRNPFALDVFSLGCMF